VALPAERAANWTSGQKKWGEEVGSLWSALEWIGLDCVGLFECLAGRNHQNACSRLVVVGPQRARQIDSPVTSGAREIPQERMQTGAYRPLQTSAAD